MQTEKSAILAAMDQFIQQRPGLDPRDYGSAADYRSEYRSILRDKHDADRLLTAVSWRDSLTADDVKRAFRGAFSGRLSCTVSDDGTVTLDYCTGQYTPTEYRAAACAVLASALWRYWRSDLAPGQAQVIRERARNELGRGIASRWFN